MTLRDRIARHTIHGDEAMAAPFTRYLLTIYTWPACTGVDTESHHSWHDTPEEAIRHLDAHSKPYAYATMVRYDGPRALLVDWSGKPVSDARKHAIRYGTNGHHPAVRALKENWGHLARVVASIHRETGEGTVHIARRMLAMHYPDVQSWAVALGSDAIGLVLGPRPKPGRRRHQWS